MNSKFRVIHIETGEEVKGAFVLIPDYDAAARVAMAAYAASTRNASIAKWIGVKLSEIKQRRIKNKRKAILTNGGF